MTVRILPCLMLFLCFVFGANVPAWAQICPGGTTPTCQVIEGITGTLNQSTGKCDYKPMCPNGDPVSATGACSDVPLKCPEGSTGTPPHDCRVSERNCPSGSVEQPDGTCEKGSPGGGEYICPPPSAYDSATGKCLFDTYKDFLESACPAGYRKWGAGCSKMRACPQTGRWSDPCVMHPDPTEICNQADADTPL